MYFFIYNFLTDKSNLKITFKFKTELFKHILSDNRSVVLERMYAIHYNNRLSTQQGNLILHKSKYKLNPLFKYWISTTINYSCAAYYCIITEQNYSTTLFSTHLSFDTKHRFVVMMKYKHQEVLRSNQNIDTNFYLFNKYIPKK